MTLTERCRNAVWAVGVRVAVVMRWLGVWAFVSPLMIRIGNRLVPPTGHETVVPLPVPGRLLVPPGWPSARTMARGLYEPEVTGVMLRVLGPGLTLVDIGANIGYYSVIGSRLVGEAGRVFAFEPEPHAHAFLLRNLAENECHNVTASRLAASSGTGEAAFCNPKPEHGYLGAGGPAAERQVVSTTTLDGFFAELGWPKVDVVKIDIEGGENAALGGMAQLSQRNPEMRLVIELNVGAARRSGVPPETLLATLVRLGFRHGQVIERSMQRFLLDAAPPRILVHRQAVYNLLCTKAEAGEGPIGS